MRWGLGGGYIRVLRTGGFGSQIGLRKVVNMPFEEGTPADRWGQALQG